MAVNSHRIRPLRANKPGKGPVIYWMSRDQRARDNWALLFSQELALRDKSALAVVFCLSPEFLGATIRQYHFMLEGLKRLEPDLRQQNIPFFLLLGSPSREIPRFLEEHRAGALVTDFSPLSISRSWKEAVLKATDLPIFEVDAHNIVPCWHASPKKEYAAYTFRPKIRRQLSEFLEDFPPLKKHPVSCKSEAENDWTRAEKSLNVDMKVPAVQGIYPGEAAAAERVRNFVDIGLSRYDQDRNDPSRDGQSGLSPYLHFGHISAQRVALMSQLSKHPCEGFLEELIVRRELSDNFCYYSSHYDSFAGFPDWAKETLERHLADPREYLYTVEELENFRTHDDLWNAAQMEMVYGGKMHGYMRMYWAKKILEWTESPEVAQKAAVYLNDLYELDGRDPNGYTGIAWSIGGVHDRAWKERAIFGKVRFMSHQGASRKFDIDAYIRKVEYLAAQAGAS
jgi:deoxyribodipyrimidine photo-lyase